MRCEFCCSSQQTVFLEKDRNPDIDTFFKMLCFCSLCSATLLWSLWWRASSRFIYTCSAIIIVLVTAWMLRWLHRLPSFMFLFLHTQRQRNLAVYHRCIGQDNCFCSSTYPAILASSAWNCIFNPFPFREQNAEKLDSWSRFNITLKDLRKSSHFITQEAEVILRALLEILQISGLWSIPTGK